MKTKFKLPTVFLTIFLAFCFWGWPASAPATLLTGDIIGIPESSSFTWGDGFNDLTADWSAHQSSGDGWFYGSSYAGNVDFYIYPGLSDPTSISLSEWTTFAYSDGYALANQGDTVFFRGTNGYYGAWYIGEIYANPAGDVYPYSFLNGTWYFNDVSAIPLPGAVWLLGSGLVGLIGYRRFRKK
jgi:hypothetical protein